MAEKRKPAVVMEDEDEDKDYTPPKRMRPEPASPKSVFGSDREEIIEETEQGETLVSLTKVHGFIN
jgi:hypothetical protein